MASSTCSWTFGDASSDSYCYSYLHARLRCGPLFAFGLFRLFLGKHPRFGGMQVGFPDLTICSLLTASAHGAGFMLLPILLGAPAAHGDHMAHMHETPGGFAGIAAVLIHFLAYLQRRPHLGDLAYLDRGIDSFDRKIDTALMLVNAASGRI